MKIEVSNGEIVDKFTILLIKAEKITDEEKLKNINNELDALKIPLGLINVSFIDFRALITVNRKLWEVEDRLRLYEKRLKYDLEFIGLARKVYILNDERAAIKKQINIATGSFLVEEKSYKQ